jgi:DNA-directed RNA polymerase subunit RPC12/RpoP
VQVLAAGLWDDDPHIRMFAARPMSEPFIRLSVPATRYAECPKCHFGVTFQRKANPRIDGAGFESFAMRCTACGKPFSGIIDPYDGAFLAGADAWPLRSTA